MRYGLVIHVQQGFALFSLHIASCDVGIIIIPKLHMTKLSCQKGHCLDPNYPAIKSSNPFFFFPDVRLFPLSPTNEDKFLLLFSLTTCF